MARVRSLFRLFGFDPVQFDRTVRGIPAFVRSRRAVRAAIAAHPDGDQGFPITSLNPVLGEDAVEGGVASGQYFHQDLYVARRLHEIAPDRHVDVGSRVDGFVAHVAAFRQIEVIDIRPLKTTAKNITFVQADLQDPDSLVRLGKADSVSCLHAVEHFGMGRYGDPIQIDGHAEGLRNIAKLVLGGGRLHIGVPIGPQRMEFNAHRIFRVTTVPAILGPAFRLVKFSFIDDAGDFHEDVPFTEKEAQDSYGCFHGCGVFEFVNTASAARADCLAAG
jgi:hypothetical protein